MVRRMDKYVIKATRPNTRYFDRWDGMEAHWVQSRMNARRFYSVLDAAPILDLWKNGWRKKIGIRLVRLIPRKNETPSGLRA